MERAKVRTHREFRFLAAVAILFSSLTAPAQDSGISLTVRHDHLWGSCNGTLILNEGGLRFETDHQKDARTWAYADIKEFQVGADHFLKLYTYEDRSNWRLGADRVFDFRWSDETISAEQVYEFVRSRSQRPVGASFAPDEAGEVRFDLPAKHLGITKGNQGRLLFAAERVAFRSDSEAGSRTWRYGDLESISSAGPYDITLTTYEQQRFHYASRRVYNFQLKEPLPRQGYDSLWRFVNERKGQLERHRP
jgi:hypothetical protein